MFHYLIFQLFLLYILNVSVFNVKIYLIFDTNMDFIKKKVFLMQLKHLVYTELFKTYLPPVFKAEFFHKH